MELSDKQFYNLLQALESPGKGMSYNGNNYRVLNLKTIDWDIRQLNGLAYGLLSLMPPACLDQTRLVKNIFPDSSCFKPANKFKLHIVCELRKPLIVVLRRCLKEKRQDPTTDPDLVRLLSSPYPY